MKNYRLKKGGMHWRFQQSRAKIQIVSGGFGNGKTTCICIKCLQCAVDYPGSEGLMARATYPKLNDTLRKEFIKWTPPQWVRRWPTQEDNSMHFRNGSVVHFRYIQQKGKIQEDGSTTSNLLSAAYDWGAVDQVEDPEITYKDFLDLLGRIRGEAAYQGDGVPPFNDMPDTGPRFLMLTLNPARTWVYKRVIYPYMQWRDHGIRLPDLIIDPDTGQPMVELFEGPTDENAENLPKDFIKTMKAAYKGQMYDRFILGKYAAFEGLVYPDFDPNVHMITRKQAEAHLDDCIKRHVKLKVIEGYDFGLISPTCYLFGFVDDFGRIIILDGFYEPNLDYTLHPPKIREIRRKYIGKLEPKKPIIADPAIFKKSHVKPGQVSTSVAELLRGLGIVTTPGDNDITSGIAKVASYLCGHEKVPNLVTGETPGALIYFVNELGFIEDEFGSYYWKKNPLGVAIDEPQEGNDHALDDLKYMLSKLPDASKIKLPEEERMKPFMLWHEMEQADYARAVKPVRV